LFCHFALRYTVLSVVWLFCSYFVLFCFCDGSDADAVCCFSLVGVVGVFVVPDVFMVIVDVVPVVVRIVVPVVVVPVVVVPVVVIVAHDVVFLLLLLFLFLLLLFWLLLLLLLSLLC